ncbi:mitotic-spindle organizing protein 2 isoform X8 [Anguilla rostrata]|nr:mitotic-spindle organizing protein 2 isoform X3 [Anguilla anguilla]XP_035247303.1 mitotic-spindle organizing protein 2 isoform X3 [Anguilla anguilla]XP_035247304.1 mitotic-spindle organizing protein 2 isoform X3 [Anguilla anguilla]XP_035247305.1 mitotic-spindle organizing protein 2 isoform X3 [Anguilla anguilla]
MAHPQQTTTLPTAPESPALGVTISGNVQKYAMKKKKILNTEENELFELTQAAGIAVDQEVFKIIVDLLKMNVAPLAVFQTLKAMCAGQRIADTSASDVSTASQTVTAPTEPRVEDSLVSGKSSKIPAPLPQPSGLRPARVNTKIVVYSPADACPPLSQVRSKVGQGHVEKGGRDGSSQRVPRQPSASRGQKSGKSSGSSSSSSQLTSS